MGSKVAVAAATAPRAVVTVAPALVLATTTWATRHKPPTSAASKPLQSSCEYILLSLPPHFYITLAFNLHNSKSKFSITAYWQY